MLVTIFATTYQGPQSQISIAGEIAGAFANNIRTVGDERGTSLAIMPFSFSP